MLVTLHRIGEVHFRLPGTNGIHVKAKNERFAAASSRCRQKFQVVVRQTASKIAPKSVPHVHNLTIRFHYSANEIMALLSSFPSWLPNVTLAYACEWNLYGQRQF